MGGGNCLQIWQLREKKLLKVVKLQIVGCRVYKLKTEAPRNGGREGLDKWEGACSVDRP